MSREEVHTRVGQEVSKRVDLMLYGVGLGPKADRILTQHSSGATFFFGNDNNESAHRGLLLREYLPHEIDGIIHEADNICRHQFHLLGYEKLDYGPNIDWHLDPVHGKRSPLKPWFKIDFLDFHQVGDHKIIWELNRHQHLITLAKAWRLTGNRVYTNELVNQWYAWQKVNQYPLGINWASTLEVAFRSMSWVWIRNLLAGCPDLSGAFQTDLLLALQLHGRHIERYLSTYFSPNTHLLGEAVALFTIGSSCPEISAAQHWRNHGWSIVLEESDRQVRSDGVYFEQALHYHVYALDLFLHARHLASLNGRAIPERFDSTLKKMLDVIQALSEVGPPEGFGDDDGGRVFNPRRNRVEFMTDPLVLGSILYDCDKYTAGVLTEEAIWLFGDMATEAFGKPRPRPNPASKAFESGGIYLINDYEPCPQQLMIDGGPQGTGHSGHGHADALSIRFSLGLRRFLVDSGTYSYVAGPERDQFRGTGAHNTLRVDKLDQAVPDGPFAWSLIPTVITETWQGGETFDFFVGSHDGYCRLPVPVLHRRSVFHVKGGFWFVRDTVEGQASHLLESFWHFAPNLDVRQERNAIVAGFPATENGVGQAGLAMLIDHNSAWTKEIAENYVSPAYGSKQLAARLRISIKAMLPQECGVLLLPTSRLSGIGTFAAINESAIGVRGYRYQTPYGSQFLFFAQKNSPWTCGLWASDSRLLYCKLERGRLAHVIMLSGTFAEWRGHRFVSHPLALESFEWWDRPGFKKAFSSRSDVAEDTLDSDFEFFDSVP
jgi:hypothetical protein